MAKKVKKETAEALSTAEPVSAAEKTAALTKSAAAAADMVMVACNWPFGFKLNLKNGKQVHLNGCAEHLRGLPKGILPVGAYGLTRVPRADWEALKAEYGGQRFFRSVNGKPPLVFAATDSADAYARAAEYEAESRHGLEPADPGTTVTEPLKK